MAISTISTRTEGYTRNKYYLQKVFRWTIPICKEHRLFTFETFSKEKFVQNIAV